MCTQTPGVGGQLKTRGTCELQEKRLLFWGFSGYMSLNMDHVHRREAGVTPKLPCPGLGCTAVTGKSTVRQQSRFNILLNLHYRDTQKFFFMVFSISSCEQSNHPHFKKVYILSHILSTEVCRYFFWNFCYQYFTMHVNINPPFTPDNIHLLWISPTHYFPTLCPYSTELKLKDLNGFGIVVAEYKIEILNGTLVASIRNSSYSGIVKWILLSKQCHMHMLVHGTDTQILNPS